MSEINKRPVPPNEEQRLEILKKYKVLDTLPEKQFDDITRLASIICKMPITLISLIDENRQWFKSRIGLEAEETPREISFCQHAIMQHDIFEIQNAHEDPRFSDNPLVTGDPNIAFYAGAPLKTSGGLNLGTLCVIDSKPNKLTEEQKEALSILAKEVVSAMEQRKAHQHTESERQFLNDTNTLLNTFFENSPSSITMRDKNNFYLYANGHALYAMGKRKEEVIGKHLTEVNKPDLAKEVAIDDELVIRNKTSIRKEYQIGSGSDERHFLSTLFPLLDIEGDAYGVGTITNDITVAKKTELELQSSNERFLKIFHNSPIGHTIVNKRNGRITHVNKTFLNLFEFDDESDAVGKTSSDILKTKEEEKISGIKDLTEKGVISNAEVQTYTQKGNYICLLCSISPIDVGGAEVFLVSYINITLRKKLEIQLQDAKAVAEQATASKSSFLANMSHEIRTPLNAMLGFANLLENTQLNSEQQEYLKAIDTAGKNLLTIINDILDFSKIEAGMLTLESVPFSPQQLIHSVYTMFFAKAQSKELQFSLSIDPSLPPLVNGDPTRLNQVLTNLIGNAIKFTSEGSIIVSCVITGRENENVHLRISIKDSGIGISADKLTSIFERFTQAESATSRHFGGTGLGLSIAKRLLELQDGELRVKSEPGKGSEFYFTISYPIADEKSFQQTIVTETQHNDLRGKKILIVEDNPLNQKLALTVLKNEGIDASIAENGRIAVERLERENFDLILMDIQMPEMDGYQATKHIRQQLNLTTPIIAMTANAMAGEQEKCIDAGMNDYVTKPFKTAVLLSAIGRQLNTKISNDVNSSDTVRQINKVTDLSYLREFSGGNMKFMREMIEIFLNQNPIDLKNIDEAIKTNNIDSLRALAHSLQTSLGFIGFSDTLMAKLQEAEDLAYKKTDIETVKKNMKEIALNCHKAQKELQAILKEI